jgi:hypothetical protein
MPSLARSPIAPVRLRRSEPARSTKLNFAVNISISLSLVELEESIYLIINQKKINIYFLVS